MEIGNKILELRKKNNLSQEKLAEQVGVARQTISKWELGETSPDLKQSKKISEIFNISLDELVNISKNETNNEVVNDTNTQKLAGIILKILKGIGIFLLVFIIVLHNFRFLFYRKVYQSIEISGKIKIFKNAFK